MSRDRRTTKVILWFSAILVGACLVVGGYRWATRRIFNPYDVESRWDDDHHAMYADWKAGKILARRRIHILREPMCVDIVDDSRGGVCGFARLTEPCIHLSINNRDGCSIYDLGEHDPYALFVTIGKPEYFDLPACDAED